jgi:hypothetical protein
VLTTNYLQVGISCLLHHMLTEAMTELHWAVALPTLAEVDDESVLVYVLAKVYGSASILADRGC